MYYALAIVGLLIWLNIVHNDNKKLREDKARMQKKLDKVTSAANEEEIDEQ